MNLSRFPRKTDMAHYTLIARINAGDGKFPFVSVQFLKNHRPIPTEGATYYLRPTSGHKRTPIKIGKDISLAYTGLIRREDGKSLDTLVGSHSESLLPQPRLARNSQKPRESISSAASKNPTGPI
jgi:hypothetical protein